MSDLCNCFGIAIRQARDAHCWSQETLAERADLNRSYVGEIERGKVIPSLVTVDKLALALSISMSELMMRCEELRRVKGHKKISLSSIAC
ncbi:helix-turn-helix domain-containing protein [Undibacterium sp. SXout7W]|uniref:helix-turn-helix domain-containing protein n=1 Tax=Undibacterium sp. SXout7W TaxID=3413049 RepID=UPI003BF240BF